LTTPPVARREDHVIEQLGRTRTDPYRWLKDPNWQAALTDPTVLDPDIRSHLVAERDYAKAMLVQLTGDLTERLHEEMKARLEPDDSTVPSPDGPWAYYRRYRDGGEYPIHCRIPRDGGDEEVLVDGDARSAGSSYYELAGIVHSPDHRLVAVVEDRVGSEEYRVSIIDLATGEETSDVLAGVSGEVVWGEPHELFAARLDKHHRPNKAIRFDLDSGIETTIYEEFDTGFFVHVGRTLSGRFVLVRTDDHDTSEVHVIDLEGDRRLRCLAEREARIEYQAEHHGDRWVIRTNRDAEDFRLVTAPLESTGHADWTDLVPHRAGTLVAGAVPLTDHLVRLETEDALPRIVVRSWVTGEEQTLAFDEAAYSLGVHPGYEQDTTVLRFTYSSPATPQRTYDEDLDTGERTLRKEQVVPSGHDPADYVVARDHAIAPDGESVPITLLHRADVDPDGDRPVLLYGYGAYGASMPASFSPQRFSLVDRGVVYVIAHIRGGMEKGYRWYQQGSREHRPNTHTDFIAAAERLIDLGWTRPGRIAIHGGSAGGLLVGAVANLRPELWAAVLADVPFVDTLNTMSDEDLPLTPPEWPLWGNPLADEAAYEVIASYSPYDNVAAVDYPPMYVTAGVSDPRVTYWEAAKWVAALRHTKTDDNPILFRVNVDAGHFGSAGRYEYLEEAAARTAFTLWALGVDA
jgi:oligopeptidase B